MTTNSSFLPSRVANYKLSSSYPSITPLFTKELNLKNSLPFNSCTKSWSSCQNSILKTSENIRNFEQFTNNSDLQPLNWLSKESIIDIDPLDIEDDTKDDSNTPGYEDLIDPQISHARVEVESQENSGIHDFVRFQAMRNAGHTGSNQCRTGSGCTVGNNHLHQGANQIMGNCNQNYSHTANGFVKPNLSYTQLIFMAIETCRDRAMTVNDIYQWCELNYPYYKHIGPSWKNSLRHNLSINKSFRRMPRDGQQGGPGRGAYWVVDEKERKNLLDSIYRAHQTMPLGDRNGHRFESPYSFFVNPPKNGPMLRIDGRFTDASTYLQSKRNEDEVTNENQNTLNTESFNPDNLPAPKPDNSDIEYASMMFNLAANSSPDHADSSVKLSASYNSNYSRLEEPDSDVAKPKLKNRRKSKHEKVRNYSEMEAAGKESEFNRRNHKSDLIKANHGMTSVNVIVAPHFDHIYARYQQFLPPAIASDMEKSVVSQQGELDSNPDADFLNRGYREDDEESDNDDNDNDDDNDGESRLIIDATTNGIKLEKMEIENLSLPHHNQSHLNNRCQRQQLSYHNRLQRLHNSSNLNQSRSLKINGSRRLKLCWNGAVKLNPASAAFTRQRKVHKSISSRRVRHNLKSKRTRKSKVESFSLANIDNKVEVKQEMLEPEEMILKEEPSDGYATDSTVPMITRRAIKRRPSRAHTNKSTAVRLLPVKRKASISKSSPPEKRYRSKRKKTRPLRIDESREIAAIQFLASLEKRHQNIKNLENLYNLNNFLKSSLSAGDSSCNSSVVMVHE